MESRELFLSLHLLPFHWVEGWGGSDKKASLSLSYSLARLFILQTDTMFQKLCPSCSHASLLGVSKKGLFSNSSLSPSFFFLTQEKRGGVVERGGRGTGPPLFFHWRAWDPRQVLCALLLRIWRAERNGPSDVGWSERRMKRRLWQGRRARDETDQVLDCLSRARAVTAPSPVLRHLNEILFWVRPPEVASNYAPILLKL